MKPLTFVLLMTPLLLDLSPAQAAPRVGVHPGYTRLVFDLAATRTVTAKTMVNLPKVSVQLSTQLRTEQGQLATAAVKSYSVSGGRISLQLATGYGNPKVQVLPRQGGQPQRVVIDIAKLPQSAKPAAAKPATPKPTMQKVAARKPTARPRVVIDPGHGGMDPGMVSPYLREKDVTLAVALKVRNLLVGKGVDVVMTRTTDKHLSANKRADLDARSAMASAGTVSAYISIHVNAGTTGGQGIETYYFGQPIGDAKKSLAIQENGAGSIGQELTRKASTTAQNTLGDILAQAKLSFSRDLASKVQANLLQHTGAPSRGVHTNTFYVIRNPNTAAILTEIGFGDHPKEGPKLATSAYQEKIARGISGAILAFLHLK